MRAGLLVISLFFQLSARADQAPKIHVHHLNASDSPGSVAPSAQYFITPQRPVAPFYQWDGNNGYCGEVSLMQAGMNQGQWMSQYNARLICGTGLSQSGPDGFCAAHSGNADYNSQLLIENPNPGDQPFASAGLCLANARLSYQLYDYSKQPTGMAGYQDFMTWVKAQLIAGHQVTVGVLNKGGDDPQYDHEVTINQIGTNHSPQDGQYYDDDVLYFDDHSSSNVSFTQGYTFGSLANSRDDANTSDQPYSILIPGGSVNSETGGDGIDPNPHAITAANYAFSVVGPEDIDQVTLPITLSLTGSSVGGTASVPTAYDGYNFENPEIGECTNAPPANWMNITLQVTVSNLTPTTKYNLYEYDFDAVQGVGESAALAVPVSAFNAHASQASHVTQFLATAAQFTQTLQTTSDKIVVFRCVPTTAP